MKSNSGRKATFMISLVMLLSASVFSTAQTGAPAVPAPSTAPWKSVEDAMGRPGQVQPGDVIKFAMPRKDLHVSLDGVDIKPGLALGSWTALKQDGAGAMVMGDLVLTEDEVEPVMMKPQEGGIHESAVHNHLIGESPHVMYMHIASHGDPVQMAKAIYDAVALTKTPGPDANPAPPATTQLGIDQKRSSKFSATPERSTVEFFRLVFQEQKQSPTPV